LDELGLSETVDKRTKAAGGRVQRFGETIYAGIGLVDQLLVTLFRDNRRSNHDRDVGQAGLGDVAEFIENILTQHVNSATTKVCRVEAT
jgi:hypothetical protein